MKHIHIDDQQWSEWLNVDVRANPETSAIDSHLATCEQCRAEGDRLRSLLSDFSGTAHREALREEAFWTRQRLEIAGKANSGKSPFAMRWAIPVPVAALLLVLMMIFMRNPTTNTNQVQTNDAQDEALLLQVQTDTYRQVPSALAPAGLLVEERNRALSTKKSQSK